MQVRYSLNLIGSESIEWLLSLSKREVRRWKIETKKEMLEDPSIKTKCQVVCKIVNDGFFFVWCLEYSQISMVAEGLAFAVRD